MCSEDVVRENYSALRRRALQLTGDSQRADDLVQSTFERYLRLRPPLLAEDKVRPWLFAVMRNLFLDIARSHDARWTALQDVPEPSRPLVETPSERPAWEQLSEEDVRLAINRLPASMRRPYEMHVLSKLSYREIGQLLNISVVTVGTRLHRAKHQLRMLLTSALDRKGGSQHNVPSGARLDGWTGDQPGFLGAVISREQPFRSDLGASTESL
jgi:RNA polymerase sigma-70 factor (ECF subfamily)